MSRDRNQREIEIFDLLAMIPAEQQPDDLVLPDDDPIHRHANSFHGVTKLIRLHKRSEWLAEQKYRDRLENLESRVKALETKTT